VDARTDHDARRGDLQPPLAPDLGDRHSADDRGGWPPRTSLSRAR
jgi:hypothetical protein